MSKDRLTRAVQEDNAFRRQAWPVCVEDAVFRRPDGLCFVIADAREDDVSVDVIDLASPLFPLAYVDEFPVADVAASEFLGMLREIVAKADAT